MQPGTIFLSILPSAGAVAEAGLLVASSGKVLSPLGAALLTGLVAVMILVVTAGFLVHDLGAGGALATLGVQTVSAITTFASIYHDAGFVQNGHPSWADSFYFSIVTWTTLGYGDFTILPPFHLVAAAEAMLGYLCFGLIVSFLSAAAIRSG